MDKSQILQKLEEIKVILKSGKINPSIKRILENNLEIYNQLVSFTPFIVEPSISSSIERIYCIRNNIEEIPVCKNCNNRLKFKPLKGGFQYPKYCSIKCMSTCPEVIERKRKTILDNYGVQFPVQLLIPTNEEIDLKIKDRTIKRIGEYVDSTTYILFECNVCNFQWNTTWSNIFKGTGCPKCSHHLPLTNQIVDDRLIERNIKLIRLEDVNGADTSIKFQCLICNHVSKMSPSNVFNQKEHCRKCTNKLFLTNELVDERLIGRQILRVETVKGSLAKIKWQCLKCENVWKAAPNDILNNKCGCPRCIKIISNAENHWLNYHNIPNDPDHRQVPLKIGKKLFKVDGFLPETNTVYEFWGSYFHGDPKVHNPKDINQKTGTTFGELYENTNKKRKMLIENGFNLVEMWDSEWKKLHPNIYKYFYRNKHSHMEIK